MKTNSKSFTFADLITRSKTKITRTGHFLDHVNEIVDFSFTQDIHKKIHNVDKQRGRNPYSARLMFKVILLQQWFGLSDAEAEEQIYDRKSFQDFLGLTHDDNIPDETTICRFRGNLIKNKVDKIFFEEVKAQLTKNGIKVREGKIVDATIIEAPKGRKKEDGTNTRDSEASFTKKNGRSYHGYKNHVSTDTTGTFILSDHTSTAKDHDSQHMDKVLDGNEPMVFADSAYVNKEKKHQFRKEGRLYGIIDRAFRNSPLSSSQKKRNKKLSSVRCRGEHPFAQIKCRMKFKARYKGIRKNTWHNSMANAACNLKMLVGKFSKAQKQAVVWCF